ncbi:follistatin-related protein 1-like [Oculina patagonica]
MRVFLVSFLLCNLAFLATSTEESRFAEKYESRDTTNEDPCINVLCHAGQECVVVDNNAACVCKESCPDHENPVCGSNGITFPNHCELHRTSCLEGKKISIKYDGECKGQPTQPPPTVKINQSKPVVCYEHDRDEVRSHLIGWLKNQNKSPEGSDGYRSLLQSYFDKVDENNDGKLDETEFREFVGANQSIAEIVTSDEYINPVLQNLCADALLSISDEDSDWELNITEFMKCLDPEFKPPKKGCELDSEIYSDGTEIPTDCNSCVCACGHWVCTALKCDGRDSNQPAAETSEDETEENPKFIVNEPEAKEQLTREIIEHDQKERSHHHQKKVLPLHKPRHHRRHNKHGKHGSRERGHDEN